MKKNILVLIISCSLLAWENNAKEKTKIYALCTPSHQVLADTFFLPSIQDNFEIILKQVDQTCASAQFLQQGWTKTTIQKVNLIIQAIKDNWGEIFIFSDIDIQFFEPIEYTILKLMKNDLDLVIQKNDPRGVLCSGFFACRANQKTLKLWQDVLIFMKNNRGISDQRALNRCLRNRRKKKNPYGIRWKYLPSEFFCGGTLTGRLWHPGKRLFIPENIVIHHANWTVGIKNKIKQLQYVQSTVRKRRKKNRMILPLQSAHRTVYIPDRHHNKGKS